MAQSERLWITPPARLRPANSSIDLPLRPSPLARRAVGLVLLAWMLFAGELLLRGLPAAALATVALAACFLAGCRQEQRRTAGSPRRLVVSAGGQMYLITADGIDPVHWLPSSLRLGRWLLLHFQVRGQAHLVLLGPDNVDPALLAVLRRRTGNAEVPAGSALQSE